MKKRKHNEQGPESEDDKGTFIQQTLCAAQTHLASRQVQGKVLNHQELLAKPEGEFS